MTNDNINNLRKTVAARSLKRQRSYFDSADWSLNKTGYENLPSALTKKQEEVATHETFHAEEIKEEKTKAVDEAIMEVVSFQNKNQKDSMGEKKENPYSHYKASDANIIAKKRLEQGNRKYFDSADWALNKCNTTLPKLTVLKS